MPGYSHWPVLKKTLRMWFCLALAKLCFKFFLIQPLSFKINLEEKDEVCFILTTLIGLLLPARFQSLPRIVHIYC